MGYRKTGQGTELGTKPWNLCDTIVHYNYKLFLRRNIWKLIRMVSYSLVEGKRQEETEDFEAAIKTLVKAVWNARSSNNIHEI